MGRRSKYNTDEERREARRESNRRYRLKKKQQRMDTDIEWNKLMAINPDLFPIRTQLSSEQKEYIKSMMTRPIDPTVEKTNRRGSSEAKKQLGLAMTKIRRGNIGSIDFNIQAMTKNDQQWFFDNVEPVLKSLLDKIDLNEHWTVYYEYDGSWKQRTLDSITQSFLTNQLHTELGKHRMDIIAEAPIDSDSSFFPVQIRYLSMLRFVNESMVGTKGESDSNYCVKDFKSRDGYKVYQLMTQTNCPKSEVTAFLKRALKKNIKVNSGKFWRWYLTINGLNLERYMIFHQLDKRTVQIVTRDNCFIYACRMAGLNDYVIDEMRCCIRKRSFSIRDIKEIAVRCNIKFIIKKQDGRNKTINKEGETTVKLLLYEDHYMLNEKVAISPYYLKHREQINRECRYWKLNDRMLVNRFDGRYYKKSNKLYSLRKVLKAIFEIDGFKTISSGDFMTFNSTVCFENIDSIKCLEYNERFCCRLKYDYTADGNKLNFK